MFLNPECGLFYFTYLFIFRATPVAYQSSQARGPVRATADGHSNAGSEPRPKPQLTAIPDPLPSE